MKTAAETCHANGWEVGQLLQGNERHCYLISAIGQEYVLIVPRYRTGDGREIPVHEMRGALTAIDKLPWETA